MRAFLLILSALGTALFGGLWAVSVAHPLRIEQLARGVVALEVERRVAAHLDRLRVAGASVSGVEQGGGAGPDLRAGLRQQVAGIVDEMQDPACGCRKLLVLRAVPEALETGRWQARPGSLIGSAYAGVVQDLIRELRIFSGSNALAFALLGGVTLLRRRAGLQLALPAVVLVGATLVTGGLYLFNQDWLRTVVFGDYVGLAYAGYLGAVALLLADIVFNRARITAASFNLLAGVAGASIKALPC